MFLASMIGFLNQLFLFDKVEVVFRPSRFRVAPLLFPFISNLSHQTVVFSPHLACSTHTLHLFTIFLNCYVVFSVSLSLCFQCRLLPGPRRRSCAHLLSKGSDPVAVSPVISGSTVLALLRFSLRAWISVFVLRHVFTHLTQGTTHDRGQELFKA